MRCRCGSRTCKILDFFFSGSSFLPNSSVSARTSASRRPAVALVRLARATASARSASFLLGAAIGDEISLLQGSAGRDEREGENREVSGGGGGGGSRCDGALGGPAHL